MASILYLRVSSEDQSLDRQKEEVLRKGLKIDKIFEEKVSGKDTNRPELKRMLDYIREGDTVYIESISRLSRNVLDFLTIVKEMSEKGVDVVSLKEQIDTTSPVGRAMLPIFGAMYQLERENIKERQKVGIEVARKKGVHLGRPKMDAPKNFEKVCAEWEAKKITAVEAMNRLGLKKTTFYKLIRSRNNA